MKLHHLAAGFILTFLTSCGVSSLQTLSPSPSTSAFIAPDLKAQSPDVLSASQTRACSQLRQALLDASQGLLWTSESDYPWRWWIRQNPAGSEFPTPAAFASLVGYEGQPVEVRQFDEYFRWVTTFQPGQPPQERRSVRRYRRWVETLQQNYDSLIVYKVGTIQVKVFVLGIRKDGSCGVSGLRTLSIET